MEQKKLKELLCRLLKENRIYGQYVRNTMNLRKTLDENILLDTQGIINRSFVWRDTKEGDTFWRRWNNIIDDEIDDFEIKLKNSRL